MTVVLFLAGIAALIGGAEALVRGSAGLASRFGVSQLIVGLTVVAFGTSSPELAVSVTAAAGGQPDLALGNVVGSNIANVLLILGLAALIVPLSVTGPLIGRDVPVMIAASCLLVTMAADGRVSRVEGALLVACMVAYTALLIRARRGDNGGRAAGPRSLPGQVTSIGVGLSLLVLGSHWLVTSAVTMALALGISELVVGLTVVAVGTSMPEIASSVVAALRGHGDLAAGNVVGSNIINTLGVLGVAAAVAPNGIGVPATAWSFDLPVMLAAAVVCLPIARSGRVVSRREGALLIACYAAYTAAVVLASQRPEVLLLPAVVTPVVLAGAVALLAVLALRAVVRRRR